MFFLHFIMWWWELWATTRAYIISIPWIKPTRDNYFHLDLNSPHTGISDILHWYSLAHSWHSHAVNIIIYYFHFQFHYHLYVLLDYAYAESQSDRFLPLCLRLLLIFNYRWRSIRTDYEMTLMWLVRPGWVHREDDVDYLWVIVSAKRGWASYRWMMMTRLCPTHRN
jgi:hypothetical protein